MIFESFFNCLLNRKYYEFEKSPVNLKSQFIVKRYITMAMHASRKMGEITTYCEYTTAVVVVVLMS